MPTNLPFCSMFEQRSIENPNTSLQDPDAWFDAFGSGNSRSGVRVNPSSALEYPPLWGAVNLIAGDVAKLPLIVKRRRSDGGREPAPDHQAFQMLKYNAHEHLTSFHMRFTVQAWALLWGNGYVWVRRDERNGSPISLVPVRPDQTRVYELHDGSIIYETTIRDEQVRILDVDMIHIKGLGDGVRGESIVSKLRDSIGTGLSAKRYSASFMRNSIRPSAILTHPQTLSEEAHKRLKSSWQKTQSGADNAGSISVLEEGLTLQPWSMSNEDAQFLQLQELEVRMLSAALRIPPHKLGDPTRTSFSSLAHENQSYLDSALDPWLVNWEHELRNKLLTEDEKRRDTHTVKFSRQALLQANISERGEFYNKMIGIGMMSRDEARSLEDMNPIPDGAGKSFLIPLNMKQLGIDEDEDDQTIDEIGQASFRFAPGVLNEDLTENNRCSVQELNSQKSLLKITLSRMAKRLWVGARKRSKYRDTFVSWLDDGGLYHDNLSGISDILDPVLPVLSNRHSYSVDSLAAMLIDRALDVLVSFRDSTDLESKVIASEAHITQVLPELISKEFFDYGDSSL